MSKESEAAEYWRKMQEERKEPVQEINFDSLEMSKTTQQFILSCLREEMED